MTQSAPHRHKRSTERLSSEAVEFMFSVALVAIQITWIGAIAFCFWKVVQLIVR